MWSAEPLLLRGALLKPDAIVLMSSDRASRARATTARASASEGAALASVMIVSELRGRHPRVDGERRDLHEHGF